MDGNLPQEVRHDIQLAVQGGGAKLSALAAAFDALAGLRDAGKLRVTRIAGTSAGAIIACLFAAGAKPAEIKAYFSEHRAEFTRAYRLPSRGSAAYQLGVGTPKALWSELPIRNMLHHFLGTKFVTFN